MPELPEVETIRLGLQEYLVGKTIEDVEVRLKKVLSGDPKYIIGAKVKDVRRFGKGLVIDLDNGYSIAAHIKLTGQFVYRDSKTSNIKLSPKVGRELPNKWTHVILKLKSHPFGKLRIKLKTATQNSKVGNGENAYLYYNDLRQFGWIRIVESSKLKDESFFKDLGPEFFKDLTFEKFKQIISKSSLAVKVLIMDQKKIAGVGNIYANDALFDSKILPSRKAKDLTNEETKRLYNSILKVLRKGLKNGGASELNFVNALGQEGKYQHYFLAYGRDGEECVRCRSFIKKISLGGRGTYFCPLCQK